MEKYAKVSFNYHEIPSLSVPLRLSLYMIFSLDGAAVGWAIMERISGLNPFPGYSSSPLPRTFDSLFWSLFGNHLGCLTFFRFRINFQFVPYECHIKRIHWDVCVFYLLCIYKNVICTMKLVILVRTSDADMKFFVSQPDSGLGWAGLDWAYITYIHDVCGDVGCRVWWLSINICPSALG